VQHNDFELNNNQKSVKFFFICLITFDLFNSLLASGVCFSQ